MNEEEYSANDLEIEKMISSVNKNKIEKTLNDFFEKLDGPSENEKNKEISKPYKVIKDAMRMTNDTAEEFLKHSKMDRWLKIGYGIVLIIMLVGQIIYLNIIFFQVGTGYLEFPESTFNIFITATLIEVIAVIKLVVQYLFHDNIGDTFKSLFEHISRK